MSNIGNNNNNIKKTSKNLDCVTKIFQQQKKTSTSNINNIYNNKQAKRWKAIEKFLKAKKKKIIP